MASPEAYSEPGKTPMMICGFFETWEWAKPFPGFPSAPVNVYHCGQPVTGWRFCEGCQEYHRACDQHRAEMTLTA